MNRYASDTANLRNELVLHGIKEPMWSGFQWNAKMGGQHIRRAKIGDTTYELKIWAEDRGYGWSFERV